jgi:hypothetical protein
MKRTKGEELRSTDRKVRLVLYTNGDVFVSVRRGKRYVIKGAFMGPQGINISLVEVK